MAPQPSNTRLFVGNLAESLDEYALVKFLGQHGKISKFDYLFHKAGPRKGRPRGYAFVEYSTPEEAMRTMLELNDKLLLGRKVAIKRANEAPQYDLAGPSSGGPWRGSAHTKRATTLSIIKGHTKPLTEASQISALEAKLAILDAEKALSESDREGSAGVTGDDAHGRVTTASTANSSTIPAAAGLPIKPSASTIAMADRIEKAEPRQESLIKAKAHPGERRQQGKDRPKNEPAPKATLAMLGAGMGRP